MHSVHDLLKLRGQLLVDVNAAHFCSQVQCAAVDGKAFGSPTPSVEAVVKVVVVVIVVVSVGRCSANVGLKKEINK